MERIERIVGGTCACRLVEVGADAILKVGTRSPAVLVIVIAGSCLLDVFVVEDELLPAFAEIQVVSEAGLYSPIFARRFGSGRGCSRGRGGRCGCRAGGPSGACDCDRFGVEDAGTGGAQSAVGLS
jgi:hypothetical protein